MPSCPKLKHKYRAPSKGALARRERRGVQAIEVWRRQNRDRRAAPMMLNWRSRAAAACMTVRVSCTRSRLPPPSRTWHYSWRRRQTTQTATQPGALWSMDTPMLAPGPGPAPGPASFLAAPRALRSRPSLMIRTTGAASRLQSRKAVLSTPSRQKPQRPHRARVSAISPHLLALFLHNMSPQHPSWWTLITTRSTTSTRTLTLRK
mmetsp:Transcript_2970/g.9876  ORF Transcript_2970/g.9876 Transcript_2970/m.9876 type:complete len:205 (+) Transcript_2970:1136-1750(+)